MNEYGMESVGTRLRIERFRRHLAQWQVARGANMTASRLSQIELGRIEPSAEEVQHILTSIQNEGR